ncbi:CBS domain-containing protein [Aliikangiella sp. IMCC44359]|uniref:CBS domain-containing protein n=1 Tax=Aliikangiella sp. IMCC44359 TaxID=3459125 RepID=UPI00403AD7DE
MKKIQDIMTHDPFFLSQHANVNRARMLMADKKIRHIPIKDSNSGKLIGMLGQKAVLANALNIINRHGFENLVHREKSMDIASIMSKEPSVFDINTEIAEVANSLLAQSNGCAAIEKDGKLVGIVTSSDFVKLATHK